MPSEPTNITPAELQPLPGTTPVGERSRKTLASALERNDRGSLYFYTDSRHDGLVSVMDSRGNPIGATTDDDAPGELPDGDGSRPR